MVRPRNQTQKTKEWLKCTYDLPKIYSSTMEKENGRIVFWAQLGPKINKWSIYVIELIERL